MNKIGEINLENQIKIMDAFDFIEQFSAFTVSNIKEGLWFAFCENNEGEHDGIEHNREGENVPTFFLIEELYFEKSGDIETYMWQKNENIISIEKGAVGIYNHSLESDKVDNYYDNLDQAFSSKYQDSLKNQYIAFLTPSGNNGCFVFDTVQENGKIVALRIVLEDI